MLLFNLKVLWAEIWRALTSWECTVSSSNLCNTRQRQTEECSVSGVLSLILRCLPLQLSDKAWKNKINTSFPFYFIYLPVFQLHCSFPLLLSLSLLCFFVVTLVYTHTHTHTHTHARTHTHTLPLTKCKWWNRFYLCPKLQWETIHCIKCLNLYWFNFNVKTFLKIINLGSLFLRIDDIKIINHSVSEGASSWRRNTPEARVYIYKLCHDRFMGYLSSRCNTQNNMLHHRQQ